MSVGTAPCPARCDDCGGEIAGGADMVWLATTDGFPPIRRHPVCPGTEDLRGLERVTSLVGPVLDDVENRGADPDYPVPWRVSFPGSGRPRP